MAVKKSATSDSTKDENTKVVKKRITRGKSTASKSTTAKGTASKSTTAKSTARKRTASKGVSRKKTVEDKPTYDTEITVQETVVEVADISEIEIADISEIADVEIVDTSNASLRNYDNVITVEDEEEAAEVKQNEGSLSANIADVSSFFSKDSSVAYDEIDVDRVATPTVADEGIKFSNQNLKVVQEVMAKYSTKAKKTIHLSQVYPCSHIDVASELFYVCELGKYLKMYDIQLSLDGVILDSTLQNSKFWDYLRIAVTAGWVQDIGIPAVELALTPDTRIDTSKFINIAITEQEVVYDAKDLEKRASDYLYNILTPKKVQTFFKEDEGDTGHWIWSLAGSNSREATINSRGVKCTDMSQSYVSIIAYVAAKRFVTNTPNEFTMVFDDEAIQSRFGISDVILLYDTDALGDWFSYYCAMSEQDELQLGYLSWWYNGYERGFVQREYQPAEKLNYALKLGIQVGDVISLYERDSCQQNNHIKSISSFHFAIVRGISDKGLLLDVLHTMRTYYTAYTEFQNYTVNVKQMYKEEKPYNTFNYSTQKLEWNDVGVEYLLYDELFFITPIYDDETEIAVYDRGNTINKVIKQDDLIYWVLKDYGVDFNEKHFLQQYFKNRLPEYCKYTHEELNGCKLKVRKIPN